MSMGKDKGMANLDIRTAIKRSRIFHYEIAEALGISESALSKWLRTEMEPDKKEKVMQAIEHLGGRVIEENKSRMF